MIELSQKLQDKITTCRVSVLAAVVIAGLAASTARAQDTNLPSANHYPWDIYLDSGEIDDGGNDAFDGFGYLSLRTVAPDGLTNDTTYLSDFGLTNITPNALITRTAVTNLVISGTETSSTLVVTRTIKALPGTDVLRYIDTITNIGPSNANAQVSWGGNLGSDSRTTLVGQFVNGSFVAAGALSNSISSAASAAVTIENDFYDPMGNPDYDPPVGYAFRGRGDTSFIGVKQNEFDTEWFTPYESGGGWTNGEDNLFFNFSSPVAPGETKTFAYFLYRGESESYDENDPYAPAGSQVPLAKDIVSALAEGGGFTDLTPAERAGIENWPNLASDVLIARADTGGAAVVMNANTQNYQFTTCGGDPVSGTGVAKIKQNVTTLKIKSDTAKGTAKFNTKKNKATAIIKTWSPDKSVRTKIKIKDTNTTDSTADLMCE